MLLDYRIVSIVFAAQVNSKWAAGDVQGALNVSENTKLWAWIGVIVLLVIVIFYIFAIIIFGLTVLISNQ